MHNLEESDQMCIRDRVYMVGGNHDFALANMYQDKLKKASVLYTPTKYKLVLLDNIRESPAFSNMIINAICRQSAETDKIDESSRFKT